MKEKQTTSSNTSSNTTHSKSTSQRERIRVYPYFIGFAGVVIEKIPESEVGQDAKDECSPTCATPFCNLF